MRARSAVTTGAQQLARLVLGPVAAREAAPERVRTLASDGALHGAFTELARQRMLGVGGPRLLDCSGDLADAGDRDAVREHVEAGGARAMLAELVIADLRGRFRGAGIAAVPVKGPTLSRRIFGDAGSRPFADLDFLVATDRLRDAADVVRAAGWVAEDDPVDRRGLPLLHFTLTSPRGLPAVELHWRLHWLEERFAQAALSRSDDGVLDPHDELLALLVFYARDGLQGLRYPADVVAWCDAYAGAVDPHRFSCLLAEHPELASAARAALAAADAAIGLPDDRLLRAVAPALTRRERAALRLAAPFPCAEEDDLRATIALVNYLTAPWRLVPALAARTVIAPRAGVEHRLPSRDALVRGGLLPSARNVLVRVTHQLAALRRARRPT